MLDRFCHWDEQSIVGILERMEYTGCVCNFKTCSKPYKLKKRISNKQEDMFILPDAQEANVSQEQWDSVQELRQNIYSHPICTIRLQTESNCCLCWSA